MTAQIINLTPHNITLVDADGVKTVIVKSGDVARVDTVQGGLVDMGLPVHVATPDRVVGVVGLPDPVDGVFYLVSGFVGAAVAGTRNDVLVPGTGPKDGAVRNDKGWIVGVTRLKAV